jgi:hypothetical protein
LVGITHDVSKPSFHKDNEIVINLFVLTREEEDPDVDHYKKGEEIIAFKVEASPQVEIGQ